MTTLNEKGPLSAKRVENAKPKGKDYKMRDRDNMYLSVTKKGKKYWRMDFSFDGKRDTLKIGMYPDISLAQARIACSDAKKLLDDDINPKIAKKPVAGSNNPTFQAIGDKWYDKKIDPTNKTDKHKAKIRRYLDDELYPYIGERPIDEIKPKEVLTVLLEIEEKGNTSKSKQVKGVASAVFDYAIASDEREYNPVDKLAGALQVHVTKHHASITEENEVIDFIVALNNYSNYKGGRINIILINLSMLFFCRPCEVATLEWSDIDFENCSITVPAERVKVRKDHIIPIARQAIKLLNEAYSINGNRKYVFNSQQGNGTKYISKSTVNRTLIKIGYGSDLLTPHGFRAMARTMIAEKLKIDSEIIELQLAHKVKDANGEAYNRTKFLDERRDMMQKWADYIDGLKKMANGDNIAYMPKAAAIS